VTAPYDLPAGPVSPGNLPPLDVGPRADAVTAVRAWLAAGGSESARKLAEQAVVLIEPSPGKVIWRADGA